MIGKSIHSNSVFSVLGLMAVTATSLAQLTHCPYDTTTFVMLLVKGDSPHVIVDNEIFTASGSRIWLHFRLCGWGTRLGLGLRQVVAVYDVAGFANGVSPSDLNHAEENCDGNSDCVAPFGVDAECGYPDNQGSCAPGFIQYNALPLFAAASWVPGKFEGGTPIVKGMADTGFLRYQGTLVLDVPLDALDTFTIGFLERESYVRWDSNLVKPVDRLISAGITVLRDCDKKIPPLREAVPVVKNRFLSLVPFNPTCPSALQVTLVDIAGFPQFNGQVRWAGPPVEYADEGVSPSTFMASPLQCEPVYRDWVMPGVDADGDGPGGEAAGRLDLFGASVVPDSLYEVRLIDQDCEDPFDPACASEPLLIRTGKWGDIVWPFAEEGGSVQPDFSDIAAMVAKFKGRPDAPTKPRAQLQPNIPDPNLKVSFADISAAVDAFLGMPYPFSGPQTCP